MNNDHQYALILGGSSGLGLASAKRLAASGLNICIVHRDRKSELEPFFSAINEMKRFGVKVISYNKDALKTETIAEVINILPKKSVKVLLHSVAKGTVKPLFSEDGTELSKEDFVITINAMALSWFDWSNALIKSDLFAEDARNIAFTSEGNTKSWKYYGAVSAAKATLEALMRQMATEYAPLKITTNCIQAGMTRTKSFGMIPGSEQIAQFAEKRNPFNRLTEPEDVAKVVELLSSDKAGWINGTVLKVDGGESLR